ncbi:hypothetical protein G8770_19625 [Aestuariicella hydrocarbonica]|uniref:Uncharacterized protein n=1 Tax=Pseudomaricurvus hydrocarbonicus TaxID=1470433 RepID=A0A9E5MP44_9GAMM|nr:hypothetical protein [Aestuariicella hydrocarbonica]NHO67762.1 hypothetical protein [Aestuariicella hydrocarbonica]
MRPEVGLPAQTHAGDLNHPTPKRCPVGACITHRQGCHLFQSPNALSGGARPLARRSANPGRRQPRDQALPFSSVNMLRRYALGRTRASGYPRPVVVASDDKPRQMNAQMAGTDCDLANPTRRQMHIKGVNKKRESHLTRHNLHFF